MHRTNEPAESDVMVQGLQTAPCFSSRGNINERKENSSHKLQHKYRQRSAAKDVPPASGVSRHGMFGHLANRRRKLKAVVKPVSQFRNHSHGLSLGSESYPRLSSDASALWIFTNCFCAAQGGCPLRKAVAAPGVGSSPA